MTDDLRTDLPSPGDPEFATLILAYADGELTEADMARAEALLETSPEAQDLYNATIDQMDALSDLFDMAAQDMVAAQPSPFPTEDTGPIVRSPAPDGPKGLTAPPRPAPPRAEPRPQRSNGRLSRALPLALTAGASLVAGIALGPLLTPSEPTRLAEAPEPVAEVAASWRKSAAIYQRLFTEATYRTSPIAPETTLATWTSAAPLFSLAPDRVDLPPGLELQQMQLLEVNGRPLLQVAFLTDDGRPISLCIFPRGDGGDAPIREFVAGELLDLTTVDWKGRDNAYMLIGNVDAGAMTRYAAVFADQLI